MLIHNFLVHHDLGQGLPCPSTGLPWAFRDMPAKATPKVVKLVEGWGGSTKEAGTGGVICRVGKRGNGLAEGTVAAGEGAVAVARD